MDKLPSKQLIPFGERMKMKDKPFGEEFSCNFGVGEDNELSAFDFCGEQPLSVWDEELARLG